MISLSHFIQFILLPFLDFNKDILNNLLHNSKFFIYVLQLENNYFFVNRSNNVLYNIFNQFNNKGFNFTKKFKPIKIIEITEEVLIDDLKNKTIEIMLQFGWKYVRGYIWKQEFLISPPNIIKKLLKNNKFCNNNNFDNNNSENIIDNNNFDNNNPENIIDNNIEDDIEELNKLMIINFKKNEEFYINYSKSKNNKCNFINCNKNAFYNFIYSNKPLFCFKHKLNNMVRFGISRCFNIYCMKNALYNVPNSIKPLYCRIHKEYNMINIFATFCKTPFCDTQITDKFKGYCSYCFMNVYPEDPYSINYKIKQKSVFDFLKNTFPTLPFIFDKKIRNGISYRKPDVFLDLNHQIIIIEIDEYQHIRYDLSCENKRLMEISLDTNHRPIIFIRFNPDEYSFNNTKIPSCWKINKNGSCSLFNSNDWKKRLFILKNEILYWLNNISLKTILIKYLFFNEEINL